MTGQCPTTRRSLVDAAAGDQSTESHLNTDIDVRVTSQPCRHEQEAGAGALASRAQETPQAPRPTTKAERQSEAQEDALLHVSDRSAGTSSCTGVGSSRVMLHHEAESHFQAIAKIAAQQFHIYRGADQLILFHKNTFELGGVKTEKVIPGTFKASKILLTENT